MSKPTNESELDHEFERLDELCCHMIDGSISKAQFDQLQQMMRGDVRLVDRYVQWFRLHARLDLELGIEGFGVAGDGRQTFQAPMLDRVGTLEIIGVDEELADRTDPQPSSSRSRAAAWAALAAAVLAAVAAFVYQSTDQESPKPADRQPQLAAVSSAATQPGDQGKRPVAERRMRGPRRVPRGLGVISQAMAAVWSDESMATDVGARVPEKRLQLTGGTVQIELVNGVTLIVQAPADFEIESPQRMICHSGQIRAHVPKVADAFSITTPSYEVVDLGTEFAVNVALDGASKCHVIDGEVEVHLPAREDRLPVLLKQGESVVGRPGGRLKRDITADNPIVVDARTLAGMASKYQSERCRAWREFSEDFRQDPSMLVYFDFEDLVGWSRTLSCRTLPTRNSPDGAIVGCQIAQGRWPEKTALEFKRVNDRVRINVPGEFDSLSMAAWIRIEGFERSLSSIMLTDGHDLGEVHWQITDYGALRLGVKAEPDRSHDFDSPGVVTPDVLGRWLHVAVVYDGPAGRVSHYVNGKVVSTHKVATRATLRLGPSEIGNWAPIPVPEQDVWQSIRSLNGRMDDFAILARPLTPDEVAQIENLGRP